MRCPNCGESIEDAFEAYAREACPACDAPLNEKVPATTPGHSSAR